MGNSCSPAVAGGVFDGVFFPLDVLDEIWDLIESVSEGFLTYSVVVSLIYIFRFLSFIYSCLVISQNRLCVIKTPIL